MRHLDGDGAVEFFIEHLKDVSETAFALKLDHPIPANALFEVALALWTAAI